MARSRKILEAKITWREIPQRLGQQFFSASPVFSGGGGWTEKTVYRPIKSIFSLHLIFEPKKAIKPLKANIFGCKNFFGLIFNFWPFLGLYQK